MKTIILTGCVLVSLFASAYDGKTFTVNPLHTQQQIDCFGASDAWSMHQIGKMPASVQDNVARLLFSSEMDESGNPEGIGLSIWRFNIGSGSAEQGDRSSIQPGTRTECFLTDNLTYDWNKQAGQKNETI